MPAALNLQRNSEVYVSTVDMDGGGTAANMTPSNTWRVDVLSGYAASQASSTQDITSLESGLTPDRSVQRFNTAINPTEWSFQTYVRPTGYNRTNAVATAGNSMPLADWFMWQALMSNTAFASGVGGSSVVQSTWEDNGVFRTAARTSAANVAAHISNFATAAQYQIYLKMDNIVYQIKNATVNEASIDAAIDSIAMTSWSGFGTTLKELVGAPRDNIISVIGGTLNSGSTATANAYSTANVAASAYHTWANYGGTASQYIKNRLSAIDVNHTVSGAGAANNYTFPVTGLGFTYNNSLTYLTPEEMATLNTPIGQFAGSRTITGNFTAYLRGGNNDSAQFLKNIKEDSRVSIAQAANANLKIGGATSPYIALYLPAVQFNFPTHSLEDIISLSVEFLAQEPTASKGTGSELVVVVSS